MVSTTVSLTPGPPPQRLSAAPVRCSICGYTDLSLRGGVCKHCRQRAVLNQARAIVLLLRGNPTSRQLKRAALGLTAAVESLDGDVPAALHQQEQETVATRQARRA